MVFVSPLVGHNMVIYHQILFHNNFKAKKILPSHNGLDSIGYSCGYSYGEATAYGDIPTS